MNGVIYVSTTDKRKKNPRKLQPCSYEIISQPFHPSYIIALKFRELVESNDEPHPSQGRFGCAGVSKI
jgi:hypothetical protein